MRSLFLCVFSLLTYELSSQVKSQVPEVDTEVNTNDKTKSGIKGYRLKGTLIDQTYFSLPTYKLFNEILFGHSYSMKSITIGLGYNNFSYDEEVKSRGYSLSAHYNSYFGLKSNSAISFGLHYTKSTLDDYLKVKKSYSSFTYFEYEKMKYYKKRYAFSINYVKIVPVWEKLFFEMNLGTGVLIMITDTPNHVVQQTFINGTFKKKEVVTPSINIGIKLGYEIY